MLRFVPVHMDSKKCSHPKTTLQGNEEHGCSLDKDHFCLEIQEDTNPESKTQLFIFLNCVSLNIDSSFRIIRSVKHISCQRRCCDPIQGVIQGMYELIDCLISIIYLGIACMFFQFFIIFSFHFVFIFL